MRPGDIVELRKAAASFVVLWAGNRAQGKKSSTSIGRLRMNDVGLVLSIVQHPDDPAVSEALLLTSRTMGWAWTYYLQVVP